ncbi:MAG TPA: Ig-like domain-containing protein, partial [Verrucomicrobiota bacterium]|nr:Ig-like domain-containing protein [Verrucomicrobiota bacterium]
MKALSITVRGRVFSPPSFNTRPPHTPGPLLPWLFQSSLLLALLLWAALPARAGTEPLSLVEIPAGSSFFSASVTNTFDGIGTGAVDDWTLEAEGGDRLTARIEATVGNSRPRLRLLNPSGQTIATVDGGTTGVAEFYNVLLPVPGAYRVRVYTDNQVSDYRLRVDVGRGAALEAEPNDSTNTANVVPPIFLAGSFRFRIGATLPGTDSAGDFFSLGTLDTGNTLAAELVTGPYSTLQPGNAVLDLFRLGETNAVFTASTNFSFLIPQRGDYVVRITSSANRDLFARYFLTLTLTDDVPPSVQAASLPAEGTSSSDIINAFTVTFSEPMLPTTVTNTANFTLRQPGPDTEFGTGDDILYPLVSPAYSSGNTATFAVVDGPIQPGPTRFNIASTVTDRAGNPINPAFVRNFTIERLGLFQFENRSNDTAGAATVLSLNASNAPDGSFWVGPSYSAGSNPYFV